MIIIIRALSLKKGQIKKEKGQKKEKAQKKGQCSINNDHHISIYLQLNDYK